MSWRTLPAALLLALGAASAPAMDDAALEARRDAQRQALASLPAGVEVVLDDAGVPASLRGVLSPRPAGTPADAAAAVLDEWGAAFRRGPDDGFVPRLAEEDGLGLIHVRMSQTWRGLPVLGGELVVHLGPDRVAGVSGRFVADLDVSDDASLTPAQAAAGARAALEAEGATIFDVLDVGAPVVYALPHTAPRLTVGVLVAYALGEEPHLDEIHVDAGSGGFVGALARMHSAKSRKIYNLNQKCVSTGSELPGTLMFQEGGSSTDTAAMGAYNGTGTTYDFFKAVFNRDSYDNAGAAVVSSVHGQFSTGFFGCTKSNAAWIDSPYNQMVFGDGDGSTLGNLALSLDVTAHELTHAVTSRTANLAYQNDSGALNEGSSDILGEATSFWSGAGDWLIGADVYTPGTAGDALRYMNDPAKDGQSADYYPTRNYASGCTPSSSNDYCGVHTNSGIANLAFYLLSQGGTHPRGKTTLSVPGVGITVARAVWYRALTTYMTSSTTFQQARTATANAAADLYGGSCSSTWQSVQKAWDAVGVPGTWSCGTPTTYAISGNAGTSGATVSAGSASATSDSAGAFSIAGLAAGTYTVTPSKSGCTFTPASRSVTVGPSATGVGFTASCGGTIQQIFVNPGFEAGSTGWTASTGVIDGSTAMPARTGTYKAWLCGYGFLWTDTLTQTVTIPASATKATLSFWLRVSSAETTTTYAYDRLRVQVRNSSGTVLKTLATYSNLHKGSSYVQRSFDVTAYKGQTIQVHFAGSEDFSKQTGFLIDDTSLAVQ